ncbi:MAG: class I SAM-dependent methyltransferase [Bacteroidota bacterium]
MPGKSPTEIAIFEGERAQGYDDFVYQWIPPYQDLMTCVPVLLSRHLKGRSGPILVVGSGTGNEINAFHQRFPHWKMVGIDPSPDMVAQSREKLAHISHLRIEEGYVADLPTSPQFEAATLLLVLHFVPDDGAKLELLKDIRFRLTPGAPLIIADIFGSAAELTENLALLQALLPPELDPEAVQDRLEKLPGRIQHIPEKRLQELLGEAGFEPGRRFLQSAIYGGWITYRT